jgi:hypothetical protein
LQFFGSGIPGNVSWDFGGVLPFQKYLGMIEGDGFAWWNQMEPSQGNFQLGSALAMYNFAKPLGIKVRPNARHLSHQFAAVLEKVHMPRAPARKRADSTDFRPQ